MSLAFHRGGRRPIDQGHNASGATLPRAGIALNCPCPPGSPLPCAPRLPRGYIRTSPRFPNSSAAISSPPSIVLESIRSPLDAALYLQMSPATLVKLPRMFAGSAGVLVFLIGAIALAG